MAWSVLLVCLVQESELREKLEGLHRRLQRLLGELDRVRADITAAAIDVDNRLVFGYLHAQEAWEDPRAA